MSEILAVLALIAVPLSGVLGAWLTGRASRKNTSATVHVSQQEADTHEFTELTNAYDRLLNRSEVQYKSLDSQYQALRESHASLVEDVKGLRSLYDKVISHVIVLESLVPNPPGPPARPF